MAFDFKKEYRAFYLPKGEPEILSIPEANSILPFGGREILMKKVVHTSKPSAYCMPLRIP